MVTALALPACLLAKLPVTPLASMPTVSPITTPASTAAPASTLAEAQGADEIRQVETRVVRVEIDLDEAPASVEDAYLRLHLLSSRLVAPHGLNLNGLFGVLPNNAWTTVAALPASAIRMHTPGGPIQVYDGSPLLIVYGTHGDAATQAALRTAAEAASSGDFSPLWCGQNASGCRAIPAGEITRALAAGLAG